MCVFASPTLYVLVHTQRTLKFNKVLIDTLACVHMHGHMQTYMHTDMAVRKANVINSRNLNPNTDHNQTRVHFCIAQKTLKLQQLMHASVLVNTHVRSFVMHQIFFAAAHHHSGVYAYARIERIDCIDKSFEGGKHEQCVIEPFVFSDVDCSVSVIGFKYFVFFGERSKRCVVFCANMSTS